MKREELEALGVTKESIDKILDLHHKELDPVKKELETAKETLQQEQSKTTAQQKTIDDLKKDLDEFKDADVSGMKQRIADLEKESKDKDTEYQQKLADKDFAELLKDSITTAKGKNAKAITALLDVETLKASKNQKEDVAAALKTLAEAEDSKMLFGEAETGSGSTGNVIGTVTKGGNSLTGTDAMRSIMGLPPLSEK